MSTIARLPDDVAARLSPDDVAARRVPDVARIAVLRANALGDFVFALPALDALRAAYPDAEIALLGRAWHESFLQARPSPVDRVIALPDPFIGDEASGAPDAVARERLLAVLSAELFDVALQMHGGGRNSNPIVAALGARVTAGPRTPDAPALDRSLPYVYHQHDVVRLLEVAGLVGAPPVTLQPHLTVTDGDRRAASEALDEADIDASAKIAVLHPGASDPRRRWPPEAFGQVGDQLARRGLIVVVTGTGDEATVTAGVATAMQAPMVDLVGRLSLPALAGLLERAAIVVSNDTGPLHLADAVGARTVGIYWFGNYAMAAPLYRARHVPILAWRLACPECGADATRESCEHRVSFVADVAASEVEQACDRLLGDA